MVDQLCDIVIPSDATSRGAHEFGVTFCIDTTLHPIPPAPTTA